jgi:putative membrane protein
VDGAYLYVKALHLIAVVSWFAGLLYIVRLFIYHVESGSRPEPERNAFHDQFALMERRLWLAITTPAMVATAVFGLWLMVIVRAWTMPWFHLKLALLALLFGYHFACGRIRKDLAAGRCRLTSGRLRLWNEAATLLLFAIVFAAVLKSPSAAGKAMLGVAAVALAAGGAIAFSRRRKRKDRHG